MLSNNYIFSILAAMLVGFGEYTKSHDPKSALLVGGIALVLLLGVALLKVFVIKIKDSILQKK